MVRLYHTRRGCTKELSCIAGIHGVLVIIIVPSAAEQLYTTVQIQVRQGVDHQITVAVKVQETAGGVHYVC